MYNKFYGLSAPILLALRVSDSKNVIKGVTNSTGLTLLRDLKVQLEIVEYMLFQNKTFVSTIEDGDTTANFMRGLDKFLYAKTHSNEVEVASVKNVEETDLFGGDSMELFSDVAQVMSGTNSKISDYVVYGKSLGSYQSSYIKTLPDLVRFLAIGRVIGHPEIHLDEDEMVEIRKQASALPREYTGTINVGFDENIKTIKAIEENKKAFDVVLKMRELADKKISGVRKIDIIIQEINKQLAATGDKQQYFGKRIGVLRTYTNESSISRLIVNILSAMEGKSKSDKESMCNMNISLCEKLIDVDKHSDDIDLVKKYKFPEYVTAASVIRNFEDSGLLEMDSVSLIDEKAKDLYILLEEEGYLYQVLHSSISLATLIKIYSIVMSWDLKAIKQYYGIELTREEALSVEIFLAKNFKIVGFMPFGNNFFRKALKTGVILSTKSIMNLDPKNNEALIRALKLLEKDLISKRGRMAIANARLGSI